MLHNLLFLLSISLLLHASAVAQQAAIDLSDSEIARLDRVAGLQYDVDYLVNEAQSRHAGPSRPAFSEAFLSHAETMRAAIADSSDLEVLVLFMELTALLGDGHTGIYGPTADSPLEIDQSTLPLRFYWFEEGLYIIDGLGEAARFAGSQVLRFGELSPAQVSGRLESVRSGDNDMTWVWMAPQFYLPAVELLSVAGATEALDRVELTLRRPSGEVEQLMISGADYTLPRKLRPSPSASGEVPLYLSQVDSNYWLHSLPEHRALYFQFNQVRDREELAISQFAEQLAQRLEAESVRNLIVDVRHNNGGNNRLLRPLVQKLIAFEQAGQDHRIFVITGRNTFSAAQNFINRVERWTDALFVGEPSSSSPNFVGEETTLLLPYSKIAGSLSDRYWQDSDPFDDRAWITPDIPVAVTARDYFSGQDAALAAVFRHIER